MSRCNCACRALTVVALLTVGTATRAQDTGAGTADAVEWIVGMSAQLDDESNDSFLAMFDLGLSEATWVSFAAGQSHSPAAAADVTADTLEIGVDHRFGLVGVSLLAERWGDSGNLVSADWRGSIYLATERFRLGLEREHRDIDIYFTVTDLLGRTDLRMAGLNADGTGLTFRVGIAERLQLYGSWIGYDYSRNVSLLPRVASLNFLSTSALTLANSFVDDAATLGIEWTIGERLLNLSVARDESAIDGATFGSIDAAYLFPVGRRMDVEINVGYGDSELIDSGVYGGILLLIYGG